MPLNTRSRVSFLQIAAAAGAATTTEAEEEDEEEEDDAVALQRRHSLIVGRFWLGFFFCLEA
jgi:hypothetical protein